MAWEAGAEPVVVLAKADLAADPDADRRAMQTAAPGVTVLVCGAGAGGDEPELRAQAHPDRTLVLVGESGAGKSTLANRLLGAPTLATGAVRGGDAKGRHTTVARHLVALPGGGALIDTPGLRELGLWGGGAGLDAAFADVTELARACRFGDCRHEHEPGCAVRAAVADGRLDPARVASHADLQRELDALALR